MVSPLQRQIAQYIYSKAQEAGINPNTALGTSWQENKANIGFGDGGLSFGPFQLYSGGGLGNEFKRKYGSGPNASNWQQQVDFAVDTMRRGQYQHWNAIGDTARKAGYANAGSGKGNNILGPVTAVGQRVARQLGLPMMAQSGTPSPTGTDIQQDQPSPIDTTGFTEAKGQMPAGTAFPNDFLSQLGFAQKSDDGYDQQGPDLGSRLVAAGAALMARDNPQGAAALTAAIGSPRTKSARLRPQMYQAPNDRGYVALDPQTGQPRFIPAPQEALGEPTKTPDQLETDRLDREYRQAQIDATRARIDDKSNPDKPREPLKPADIDRVAAQFGEAESAKSLTETANTLSRALAEGKVKPNFVKGIGWKLQAGAGVAPEEALGYNQMLSVLNKGILQASKDLKGSISDKDLKFLTETIVQGGANGKLDAGSLYNSLREVARGAQTHFKRYSSALEGSLKNYPGTLGNTPDEEQALFGANRGIQQGWQDFESQTLGPLAQKFFQERFGGTNQQTPNTGPVKFANPEAQPQAATPQADKPSLQQKPPVEGARQAPDGNWYVQDPNRPGKYLRVR